MDDNAEITDSIGRLIGQRYHIITAHDARLAFSRLQDQNIDLMVCDLKMPGTDGLTLCREVKNDLSTSHIPVIILTAQATDDTHAACYEAGADGYLTNLLTFAYSPPASTTSSCNTANAADSSFTHRIQTAMSYLTRTGTRPFWKTW